MGTPISSTEQTSAFATLIDRAEEAVIGAYETLGQAQRHAAQLDLQSFGELVTLGQMLLFCAERLSAQAPLVAVRAAETADDY